MKFFTVLNGKLKGITVTPDPSATNSGFIISVV